MFSRYIEKNTELERVSAFSYMAQLSKTKYVGQKSIEASTSLAVSTFNEGSMTLASVLMALFVPLHTLLSSISLREIKPVTTNVNVQSWTPEQEETPDGYTEKDFSIPD